MNKCKICGTEKEYRPAGQNKTTGKSFDAFYSCPNWKQHKEQGLSEPRQAAPQTPVQKFNQSLDQNLEDEKWKKIRVEKEGNIRWCNSLNNASLLIAHNPVANQTDQDIITRLYMLAVRIDSLEPKAPQTPAPISPTPTPLPRHGDQLSDEEISKIPFNQDLSKS